MRHKIINAILAAGVSLTAISGIGQVSLQRQTQGLSSASNGAAADRSRIDTSDITHSAALVSVPEDFAKLKLAPGFLVRLNVLQDPDFTGEFRVDEKGDLELPVLGLVHVGGETATEAIAQIKTGLITGQILKDPMVTLAVEQYTLPEVAVIGEVTSPGKYPLLAPSKLMDVLALAGGPTLLAGNEIEITSANTALKPVFITYSRSGNTKPINNVMVHPGDTVVVKRAGVVYVLGAVNRPGGYVMQEDGRLSLLEAISLANGTAAAASKKEIYLLRENGDGTEVDLAIPYKKVTQGRYQDMQLRAKDIVYVPSSTVKTIFTNSQSVIASAASASIYAGVLY